MNRLTGRAGFEQTIRKSRFIGVCGPSDSPEAALAFIAANGEPGCRHVCYAFRCADTVRFEDAGEPGGTAGRPILAALDHHELDRSVVVVSRFFGGIKLGTGGLARAYGATAMETLARAATAEAIEPIIETIVLDCRVPFDSAGDLHQLADRAGATKRNEHWDPGGLQLKIEIERALAETFIDELTAITRGESSVRRVRVNRG